MPYCIGYNTIPANEAHYCNKYMSVNNFKRGLLIVDIASAKDGEISLRLSYNLLQILSSITSRCQSRVSQPVLAYPDRHKPAIRLEKSNFCFSQPDFLTKPVPDHRIIISFKTLYKNLKRPTLIPERRDYLFQLVFSRLCILFARKPKSPI